MKKSCLWLLPFVLLVGVWRVPAGAVAPPDSLSQEMAAGVPVRVVRVNLADPRVHVTPLVASGFPHGSEPFAALVARNRPTIAVDGAYFSKTSLEPIGDVVIGGRMVHRGMMGTALAITPDNRAVIRRVSWGHAEDWSDYESVLGCGPALVLDGAVDVHPSREGFHDPHVMGCVDRMGVGVTPDRFLLIVETLAPVTFSRWARVMRSLGCRDAMNLDAGASTAMYYRGRTLVRAGRPLTNLLAVYVDVAPPLSARPRPRPQRRGGWLNRAQGAWRRVFRDGAGD